MLYLTVTGLVKLNCFSRVDLKSAVLDGELNLSEHVVAVAVNDLDELPHLSSGVRELLPLVLVVVVPRESFVKNRYQRAVAGKINGTFIFYRRIRILESLLNGNIKTYQSLARSRNTGYEAYTLLTVSFTSLNHFEDVGYGRIC